MPSLVGSEMCIRDRYKGSDLQRLSDGMVFEIQGQTQCKREFLYKSRVYSRFRREQINKLWSYLFLDLQITFLIMTNLENWLIAIGLAMDCLAVSIASGIILKKVHCCLLYTSDAADDMQCVDLGGRRIIKKKKRKKKKVSTTK
eukprot:TRINITY_DN12790_c0_g1_i2.p2 TRINITY_DN12790_c0_g1~~TRINITY_DN12790_c0_g1_i2.p2  ORF type:complete len:144 (+),score=24.99 TRINITY_DN12790_c0_g1_i2:79-510(+)